MIRRQRTPKIIDNGHGWRSDAIAYEKAGKIAQALRFPKAWADQDGNSPLELYPYEIITSVNPGNRDTLAAAAIGRSALSYSYDPDHAADHTKMAAKS
ncbi:hypothetical protein G6L37_04390 [Agrobacterium rubi]|nr:hypothetical protein [Agrobacterium rubi]NTF24591.1 hypothetical protein [Agrobacterium rubi]